MRGIVAILLFVVALVGCSKDKSESFEVNDVYIDSLGEVNRVLFGYESGESVTIKVAMMESWSIEVESEDEEWGFTLSKMSGKANSYESVTVKSTESNDTQYLKVLGEIKIISTSSGEQIYSISVEQSRAPAAQTTVTYFAGTSLKSYFIGNIYDAKRAISSGILGNKGRYLYFMPSSSTTGALYEVTISNGECVESLIKEYSSFRSLDEGSISTVLEDVMAHIDFEEKVNGESQRLNLVVSGHGTGWVLTSAGLLSTGSGVSSYTSEWEPVNPLMQTRYLGVSTDGYMEISELATEFETAGAHFGYILFDMCYMSSVESLYRLRDYADYVVASPCEVMGAGFPYESVMPCMFMNDGGDYDLQGICEAYIDCYTTSYSPYACVAVCVMGELEALAAAQKALVMRELTTEELYTLQTYEGRTSDHVFFDLKQYVNLAGDGSTAAALAAYNAQFDKCFPEACRLHTAQYYTIIGSNTGEKDITYYSGVTTSAPTTSRYSSSWVYEYWALATCGE